MKKILTILALLFVASFSKAQTQDESWRDSTITISIDTNTAYMVQHYVDFTRVAVAKSMLTRQDSVVVTLTQQQITDISRVMTMQPEGIVAQYNAALRAYIAPFLPDHPSLKNAMLAIWAGNSNVAGQCIDDGRRKIMEMLQLLQLN